MKIMISKSINKIFRAGIAGCAMIVALAACTDTWDDHYEGTSDHVLSGTLWQAIEGNQELSNFAKVVKECGYDKSLASSQVFTVFAPVNAKFTAEEADALIAQYKIERATVSDDDNTVIKEFLQNHIALYNHSVSSQHNDSIVMMNGKYQSLNSGEFGGSTLLTNNGHYGNGVLFTIDNKVDYFPNVFEYVRKDADLDSLRSFLYNSKFYYKEFLPEQSVKGDVVDGRIVYQDSVFSQRNELFTNLGRLNSEDSTYWFVAPTNQVWKELIDKYETYFNYHDSIAEDRDSMIYTNSRLAIVEGTVFSRTINTDKMLQDSAMSTNAVLYYNSRKYNWGADSLHYYQYNDPARVFSGTQNVLCSNGQVMKAPQWNIKPSETFMRTRIIEAEGSGSVQEVGKWINPEKKDKDHPDGTEEEATSVITLLSSNDNEYYDQVSNHGFIKVEPIVNGEQSKVTFNIPQVLSNVGYDIYLLTAPVAANDSNATEEQRVPTIIECYLIYKDQLGKDNTTKVGMNTIVGEKLTTVTTTPDAVDCFLLASNRKFDVCSFGLQKEKETAQVRLRLETNVGPPQIRRGTHTRTMYIDAIILKPHEE